MKLFSGPLLDSDTISQSMSSAGLLVRVYGKSEAGKSAGTPGSRPDSRGYYGQPGGTSRASTNRRRGKQKAT